MALSIITSRWLAPGLLLLLDKQYGYLLAVPDACTLWLCPLNGQGAPRGKDPGYWGDSPDSHGDSREYLATPVGGFFGDIAHAAKSVYGAAKGAVSSVASFVHHPPGWLAAAMPLFTTENQRYWAKKLGGSTGAQLYDAGVKAIAEKALGPQGPQLVEAYNKIVEDAAQGHVDAREILNRAPQIARLAVASQRGPEAFRAAVATTKSTVKVSGSPGYGKTTYSDPLHCRGSWGR